MAMGMLLGDLNVEDRSMRLRTWLLRVDNTHIKLMANFSVWIYLFTTQIVFSDRPQAN